MYFGRVRISSSITASHASSGAPKGVAGFATIPPILHFLSPPPCLASSKSPSLVQANRASPHISARLLVRSSLLSSRNSTSKSTPSLRRASSDLLSGCSES
jgi:hypothetical protein